MPLSTLFLGPLLGFEQGHCYTVCVLTPPGFTAPPILELSIGVSVPFAAVETTPSGQFWRAEAIILPDTTKSQTVTYRVLSGATALADRAGGAAWSFHVPAAAGQARLCYAACNGFSSAKLAEKTERPYALWEKMDALHRRRPFSLLMMGGDQVYADSVLDLPEVSAWTRLSHSEMRTFQPSAALRAQLDQFYDLLYQDRWSEPTMARMLASIPSVMMWDDHDIVDGWGSHDDIPQKTPMYGAIYAAARKYFLLYQLRSAGNRSLLAAADGHFALGFEFADYRVLALDHRSDRRLDRVMSDKQHRTVAAWIAAVPRDDAMHPVLVLSAIPVVYRSFAAVESTLEITPWTEEATDDVRDQWMASHHRGERIRLVKNLFASAAPVVLVSGDVHVGALGVLRDAGSGRSIYQIVSTGIVHPPPGAFQWAGLRLLTNDDPETLPGTRISTEMLTPSHGSRYLRDRNFATLECDDKSKLWINWICESTGKSPAPEFVAADLGWA